MDGVAVAVQIEKIHNEYASSIQYNNENSLSSVLTIAYLSAMQYYFKPIRELPTGRGFADFVFIPKPEYKSDYPVNFLSPAGISATHSRACSRQLSLVPAEFPHWAQKRFSIFDYITGIPGESCRSTHRPCS